MKKRLLYLALALFGAPLLWGQSTVVCTTASPGTVIGSCASGFSSPVTTDPVSATGVWTFDNAANTPVTLSDGAAGGTLCSVGVADTANSVCVGSNAITGEGSSADASETIIAFGNATADQTLTCTGAASSLGCVVASPAVPVNGATAGNSLALTASPAIPNAGAGTDGAAAGGSITLTAGAAARDTSGNANGGSINLIPGAGIGTGTAGQVFIPAGVAAAPGVAFTGDTNTGLYANTTFHYVYGVSNGAEEIRFGNNIVHLRAPVSILTSIGGAAPGALYYAASVETVAASKSPSGSESAELYTNGADVDGQAITLPNDPFVGSCYEFALTSTDSSGSFAIAASAGETLMDATTTCATSFSATAKGATARICAVSGGSGGLWLVMSKNGTWSCS